MTKDFLQIDWNQAVEDDCRQIVRLAIREDLDRGYDWTTVALVAQGTRGRAAVVARRGGIIAGQPAAQTALNEMETDARWRALIEDGRAVAAGTTIAEISGSARDLLTAERLILNLIGRLSGIATLARKYVEAVASTGAKIYDTRKTTPGWRRLEKYATRCGGAWNHRTGLFDAVLIKDNHLAHHAGQGDGALTPADAVAAVRRRLREMLPGAGLAEMIVEVEVDSLDQLRQVLPAAPDLVLLDNMTPDQLRRAVAIRDESAPNVQLEASGCVGLDAVRDMAATGVDRISVGALTHSAVSLDVGMDWLD